jgi:hypothetical protein
VKESAEGVGGDEAKHPEDEQYDGNGPEHDNSPLTDRARWVERIIVDERGLMTEWKGK